MREQPTRDKHHILFNRQEWTLRDNAASLREDPTLTPNLDRTVHNELHRACPAVPLLGQYALFRTLREYSPSPEPLVATERLMMSMEQAAKSPKAHSIEKSLVYLAVQAVDLQRPFIKEGWGGHGK